MINEEELGHIHPDIDNSFLSPTMNSGIMTIHQNDPEDIIDDPEDFCQYHRLLLNGHNGKTLHPTTIKFTTTQLYGVPNSHVLTDIKLFAYTRTVQCNVKVLNGSKAPAKGFGLVITTTPKQT